MRLKPDIKWNHSSIPLDIFTQDAAFLLTDTDIFYNVEKHSMHCDIFIHPGKYYKGSSAAFVLQKGSPLKEIIDYKLLSFLQYGFIERLAEKYFQKKLHDCEPPVRELDFKSTALSFFILASGAAAALLVSLLENIRGLFVSRAF